MRPAGFTKRRRNALIAAGLLLLFGLAANAGRVLVVNDPQKADVIVVLAGETDRRPARALELLSQGYAPRAVIDVPAAARIYGISQTELARKYIEQLPQAASIEMCPIWGLSTRDEARDVETCLRGREAHRILIVTSDFHTRRALAIFRHEMRGKVFSVAAAEDASQYGTRWWAHRQWAKTFLDEWLRLFWWNTIDRWR